MLRFFKRIVDTHLTKLGQVMNYIYCVWVLTFWQGKLRFRLVELVKLNHAL